MKKALIAGSLFFVFPLILCGCRSAFISTTITNRSGGRITLIEVDYPSASFGVGSLDPGAQFHYHFKVQGSGPVKLQFTSASGKTYNLTGPKLQEGDQGTLRIDIGTAGDTSWVPNLTKIR